MCGIGIIHYDDSEFHSSQFQFNTILTEIPPLILTKNDSDSGHLRFQLSLESESESFFDSHSRL